MTAIKEYIKTLHPNYHKEFLQQFLIGFLFQSNDEKTRELIENVCYELFGNTYLIRCSEIENTPAVIDRGSVIIRFLSLDNSFTLELGHHSIPFKEKAKHSDDVYQAINQN